MPTMTELFRETRALPLRDRARLVSKLIAADLPASVIDDAELARREDEVRKGQVSRIEVSSVMLEARALAGIGGKPPALKSRKV